jgi:hypothetical protein
MAHTLEHLMENKDISNENYWLQVRVIWISKCKETFGRKDITKSSYPPPNLNKIIDRNDKILLNNSNTKAAKVNS